ncbi:hypothetical protein QFZ43_004402 [Streptomyces afghaniensis]|nr:hypothetical protein [Streptomyces afghaniensis]
MPFRSIIAVLMNPAMPAAASRWAMLVFTEPMTSGSSAWRPAPRTAPRECASMGSPSDVPVPCVST